MLRFVLAVALGMILAGGAVVAQPPKDGKKDAPKKDAPQKKDTPKKDAPKEKPSARTAGKEVTGLFKSKDVKGKSLTITVDGKDRTFRVPDECKILGPRGGEAEARLEDDRLDKGFKVTVTPDGKDAELAVEIRLAFRNERDDGSAKEKK
jgi:hypothetical protein